VFGGTMLSCCLGELFLRDDDGPGFDTGEDVFDRASREFSFELRAQECGRNARTFGHQGYQYDLWSMLNQKSSAHGRELRVAEIRNQLDC
jgi:hypothetical protein